MKFLCTWSTGPATRTKLAHVTLSGPIRLFDDPEGVETICGLKAGPNVRTGAPVTAIICPVCAKGLPRFRSSGIWDNRFGWIVMPSYPAATELAWAS